MFTFLFTAAAIGVGVSYTALLVKGDMVENNKSTFLGIGFDKWDTMAKPATAAAKKIGGRKR
jgi:hypothetical protein